MEITTPVIAGEHGEIIADFSHLEFFLKMRYGLSVTEIDITETTGFFVAFAENSSHNLRIMGGDYGYLYLRIS